MLLAALAGEHLLLLGPPGTAKSELSRRLSRLTGGLYYERLLTRFSVPEVRWTQLRATFQWRLRSTACPLLTVACMLHAYGAYASHFNIELTSSMQPQCVIRNA